MTVSAQDLRIAARSAVGAWRDLLALSRPSSWPWTALPFLVGGLEATRFPEAAVVLGTIYFLAPFNLLRHGAPAVVGPDGRPDPVMLPTILAIAVTNIPPLLVLGILGGPLTMVALIVTIGIALLPAVPLVTAQPVWDQARPVHEALVRGSVATTGLLLAGPVGSVPWGLVLALVLWSIGTESLHAIRSEPAVPRDPLTAVTADRAPLQPAAPADQADVPSASPVRSATPRDLLLAPRALAGVALLAILLAVALVARHGSLGLLGAIGVALFALLPAVVLLAPDGGLGRAARRASLDRVGLDPLVGAWLGVLLVAHWRAIATDPWTVAIGIAAAATAYVAMSIVITALVTRRRRLRGGAVDALTPSVTIVVPCHDDVERLPACLSALRAQTYADATILVVDLGSTDGSVEEAGAWLGEDAVLVAPPVPTDRDRRDWARHIGATAAETDLVLFVDTDTVLAPIALRVLVEQQQALGADVMTGLTRSSTPTVGERAAVPSIQLVQIGLLPVWWSALTAGRPALLAIAMAPCLLVRTAAYDAAMPAVAAIGARGARLDLALARAVARGGGSVRIVGVADLGATRHHRSVGELVAAWRRRTVPAVPGGLGLAIGLMLAEVIAFVLPLLLPMAAVLTHQPARVVAAAGIPLALLLAGRLVLLVTQRSAPTTLLWHPVTVLLALVAQAAGVVDHVRRNGGAPVHGPAPLATAIGDPSPPGG